MPRELCIEFGKLDIYGLDASLHLGKSLVLRGRIVSVLAFDMALCKVGFGAVLLDPKRRFIVESSKLKGESVWEMASE